MIRKIGPVTDEYRESALQLVEEVFSEHENPAEGALVRLLVKEIREKRSYRPELEIMAVSEDGEIIGYAMFSAFHLEGRYEDRLLILTPVAVKTQYQRQHVSKDMLEYGFEKAVEMGYQAVIVEGNPANYRSRGFITAANEGIMPGKTVHLPHIDCLMVKELVPGALREISGYVEYSDYRTLTEEN